MFVAQPSLAAERESLFSLEVVVDEVSVPGVTCRYPSVAVRLMDFPTLTIHHADTRMIRKIQLNMQQKAEIPRQFSELQDENGNFSFQKGKSCLFKFSVKNLRSHLTQTPMYVLIVDTYPEIPKLIASCVLPLCESVEKLYEHISNVGLSIPETDGQRGEYTLRNLMGVNVGRIVFGYRLTSLGEGLLQHIPQDALVVSKSEEEKKIEEQKDPDMIPERDIPKPEETKQEPKASRPEKPDRMSKLRKSKPEILDITKVQHIFNESVMNLEFQNEGTQTDPPRKSKGVSTQEEEELVYRPPPLYFNRNAEEKILPPVQKSYVGFDYVEEPESVAEEFEEPPALVYRTPTRPEIPRPQMQYADLQQNLAQFPVLSALLGELNRIQGSAFQSQTSAFERVPQRSPVKAKPKSAPKQQPKLIGAGKENRAEREAFLRRMSEPRVKVEKPAPEDPKSRGPTRKEPPRKTKLQYGMTNTQRLRLAMNNPHMLREMEGDKPKSPIAQKLLENLATLGKTKVLSESLEHAQERPVPTPRKYPPVRHSDEFDDKKEENQGEEPSSTQADEESTESPITIGIRPSQSQKPNFSVHIPVAEMNQSEIADSLPPKFPGFKEEEDDEFPVKDSNVRDSGMKIPVINPKASKNSPISSLRNSQAFTARSEVEAPSARRRASLEARAKTTTRTMKSVSFDDDDTNTKVSSEYEPSFQGRPKTRRPFPVSVDSVHTDSVSSYVPSAMESEDKYRHDEYEDSEYSDDFEVDIPMSPTHRPSLPKVDHMGYTFQTLQK